MISDCGRQETKRKLKTKVHMNEKPQKPAYNKTP